MASIEKSVSEAILAVIRARRTAPSARSDSGVSSSMASARVREAQLSDFKAVTELKMRWGLVPDSLENWERLWIHNPASRRMPSARPIGWVLEAERKVVGYLGNISSLYRFSDKTLTAVTGSGFVVEPAFRAVSLSLVAAYYRQKDVDLYLTTTAIEAVGKVARAFKSDPLPQEDYETVLFWVLRPYPFAQELMRKLQVKPGFSSVFSGLISVAMASDKIVRRRKPTGSAKSLEVCEIGVLEIGDEFGELWFEKLAEGTRLLADRTAATLRWHFETPGDRGTTRVLCCREKGRLFGYLVIRDDPGRLSGLRRSLIADILVRQDDPEILKALIVAAYEHAQYAGSHILEVQGFPGNVRRVCSQWNPYRRKYPACPFYYKAADPTLHKVLASSGVWYASPYDGDATLMPYLDGTTRDAENFPRETKTVQTLCASALDSRSDGKI